MDFNKEIKQKSEDSKSERKKISDLTQDELMDIINTANKVMEIYNNNFQKAIEMANNAEWEMLKAFSEDPRNCRKRRKVKPKIYG